MPLCTMPAHCYWIDVGLQIVKGLPEHFGEIHDGRAQTNRNLWFKMLLVSFALSNLFFFAAIFD